MKERQRMKKIISPSWGDDSCFASTGFYSDTDVRPSPTLAVAALAKKMQAAGKDVVDMSVGEPDFITPKHIMDAAAKAMYAGQTKYTDVPGTLALKQAIIARTKEDYGFAFAPENIIVSCGAKHSIFNILFCTLRHGDEVIIPRPYWVSYPDMVSLSGGISVFCDCQNDLTIDVDSFRRSITDRTKWVIINYPSNPSGAVCSRSVLRALADVLLDFPHVNIISDDIYSALIYDTEFLNIAQVEPALLPRTVIVSGVAKAYAMTGWRIGYTIAHASLVKRISAVQSQMTSCPSSVSQAAAVEALTGDQSCVKDFVDQFRRRRDLAIDVLKKAPGLHILKPGGAFYLFPSCSAILQSSSISTDAEFSNFLLESFMVSSVPGSAFGAPGHIRISYALAESDLVRGCERIVEACSQLMK